MLTSRIWQLRCHLKGRDCQVTNNYGFFHKQTEASPFQSYHPPKSSLTASIRMCPILCQIEVCAKLQYAGFPIQTETPQFTGNLCLLYISVCTIYWHQVHNKGVICNRTTATYFSRYLSHQMGSLFICIHNYSKCNE